MNSNDGNGQLLPSMNDEILQAEVAVAFADGDLHSMPEAVQRLVAGDIQAFLAGRESVAPPSGGDSDPSGDVSDGAAPARATPLTSDHPETPNGPAFPSEPAFPKEPAALNDAVWSRHGYTRWFAAAAVIGLLASFGFGFWAARLGNPVVIQSLPDGVTGDDFNADDPKPAVAPEQWAADPGRLRSRFAATKDAGPEFRQVQGEVIWDRDQETGFMRLAGLPINDPDEAQYQLWIIDPDRGEIPVDGGVFDITSAEAWVPIDAKLSVPGAEVFAITREAPGGVVVSDGPLLLAAKLGT